ncbi:MAG TPA: flagellar export protein FliJ [Ruminococcaceae bacterium]|jgi:flagellar FliJ protein|nr:flagellar export protein FliJ [Oscillospiraceae bacterium]
MKKFRFSLDKVLEYKRQVLGLMKSELSRLQLKLRETEKKIEDTNREFEANSKNLTAKMRNGMPSHIIAVYKDYLGRLNRRVISLAEEKKKIANAMAAKRKEIVKMNSDISGLERLRDKQLGEYHAEEIKEQELFIEEFVSHTANSRAV